MMKQKVLFILIALLLIIIPYSMVKNYNQRNISITSWYENNKVSIMNCIARGSNQVASFSQKQVKIKKATQIEDAIWRFEMETFYPDTYEYLIVSENAFTFSLIMSRLSLWGFIPEDKSKEAANVLLNVGNYNLEGVGATSEKRIGYIRLVLLDDCCIYCKQFIPT